MDDEFLFTAYDCTRMDGMALVDWNAEQKESFLRTQFQAQDTYYRENYPAADFSLIYVDDQPVGRLYVERRQTEHISWPGRNKRGMENFRHWSTIKKRLTKSNDH
jgi:hypothetical protein